MKGLFHRLLKSLGFSGRDWAVLLLALLLAFSIWLIHNLSLKYNDFLTVPVVAQCSIDGHSDISSNSCQVTARSLPLIFNEARSLLHNLLIRHRSGKLLRLLSEILYDSLLAYANLHILVNLYKNICILDFAYSTIDTADSHDLVAVLE